MPKSWLQWRAPENSGVLLSFCIWFVCCASAKPFPITNISEIISASPGIPTFAFNISDNHNRKNKLHNSKTVFLKPVNDSFENWSVLSPKVTNLGDSMTKYKHWTRITASDVAKLNRLKNQSVTKNLYDYFSYDKISKANNNSAQGESEKKLNIIYSEIEESEKHKFHVDLLEASSFNLSTLKNALYLSRTDRSAPNTKANNSNHLVKFQSQPQIGLINSVSRNNRDPNLERNERSANLSHITGTARKIQLYIKNRFLQLLPDGIVNGTTDEMSDYSE